MADLFFLLAGVVLLFKKEVHISRNRKLSGGIVRILAVLYIMPSAVGFAGALFAPALGLDLLVVNWFSISFVAIAFLSTLYFVVFHKGSESRT
jgi:hypothetical protein